MVRERGHLGDFLDQVLGQFLIPNVCPIVQGLLHHVVVGLRELLLLARFGVTANVLLD